MYPIINKFLLQRPLLDLNDVPVFYSLLFNSSEGHRKERAWLLRLLVEGLVHKEVCGLLLV